MVPGSHVDARKAIKFKPGVNPSKVKPPVKNQIQTQVKTAVEIGFNFKLTRLFARVIRRMFLDNISSNPPIFFSQEKAIHGIIFEIRSSFPWLICFIPCRCCSRTLLYLVGWYHPFEKFQMENLENCLHREVFSGSTREEKFFSAQAGKISGKFFRHSLSKLSQSQHCSCAAKSCSRPR